MIPDFRILDECQAEVLEFIIRCNLAHLGPNIAAAFQALLDPMWTSGELLKLDDRIHGLGIVPLKTHNSVVESAIVLVAMQPPCELRLLLQIVQSPPSAVAAGPFGDETRKRIHEAVGMIMSHVNSASTV